MTDRNDEFMDGFLSQVSGLDIAEGKRKAGGKSANYLHLIKAASSDIRENVQKLGDYLRTGDPLQLKKASHALKIVFSNIGFDKLRRDSEKIEAKAAEIISESEAKNAIPSFNVQHQEIINDYISDTMSTILELEDAVEGYEQALNEGVISEDEATPVKPLSDEEIDEVIAYTEKAIERYEIDYIAEGLEYLRDASCGEERRKIKAALISAGSFDYEKVKAAFNEYVDLKKGRGEAR